MSVLKSLSERSDIRYGLVGVVNTGFGLCVIFSMKLLGLGDIAANAVGYSTGLLLSFRLNSRWTFEYKGQVLPAMLRFLAVVLGAYLANLIVVVVAISIFGLNSYVAQAIGVVPYVAVSYFGFKWFAFIAGSHD